MHLLSNNRNNRGADSDSNYHRTRDRIFCKKRYVLIQEKWPTWVDFLEKYNIDISGIADWFSTSDFQTVLDNIISGSGSVIDTVIGAATSTISSVVTAIFASVIAVYLLLAKKVLGRQQYF